MKQAVSVVVVAVIFVTTIGLGVTWIGRARVDAARVTCKSTQMQLGFGLHSYHEYEKAFPQGTVKNVAIPPDKRLSWFADIYRYCLTDGTDDLVGDRTKAWDSEANKTLRIKVYDHDTHQWSKPVPTDGPWFRFVCPGNEAVNPTGTPCITHFVGIAGVGEDAPLVPLADKKAGFFGFDRQLRAADLVDGASNTMVIAETGWKNGPWIAGGYATVRGVVPPYIGPDCYFGGTHSGGGLVTFADGSVHFLKNTIDPKVFEALATIAGREDVGQGWDD